MVHTAQDTRPVFKRVFVVKSVKRDRLTTSFRHRRIALENCTEHVINCVEHSKPLIRHAYITQCQMTTHIILRYLCRFLSHTSSTILVGASLRCYYIYDIWFYLQLNLLSFLRVQLFSLGATPRCSYIYTCCRKRHGVYLA